MTMRPTDRGRLPRVLCVALLVLLFAVLQGCLASKPVETPRDAATPFNDYTLDDAMRVIDHRDPWEWNQDAYFDLGNPPFTITRHPAEKYLKDWVFVIDPGHGGNAHAKGYKRGPTGVREAEMNLRVAHLLRKLLEDAGAIVHLTREGERSDIADDSVRGTLRKRAELANTVQRPDGGTGADLFISIHHNAVDRPEANYTSVWFHGEADWSEVGLDAAKYVAHHLGAALRTDVGLTSPLMSDQQMYGDGFAVLRHCKVPALLSEASFFSNPAEEQRLADPMYNLREAYAFYTALCEYAYGGRPTQTTPRLDASHDTVTIATQLSDGLPEWWGHERQRILSSTMHVTVDGLDTRVAYDHSTKTLTATLPRDEFDRAAEDGEAIVSIHHANFMKHHNWPQRYHVPIDTSGAQPVIGAVTNAGTRSAVDDGKQDQWQPKADAGPITVTEYYQETDAGPIRGFVAVVNLSDDRVETLVTGPIEGTRNDGGKLEAVRIPADDWAETAGADLVVNANFFGLEKSKDEAGNTVLGDVDIIGLSMSDGVVVSPPRTHGDRPDLALLLYADGRAAIATADDTALSKAEDAVAGVGPTEQIPGRTSAIVTAGKNTGDNARVQPGNRHPRTAAGVDETGTRLILVTIDGRQPGWSIGVTLPELADILIDAGAHDAINLDGGGSTSFVLNRGAVGGTDGEWQTNRPSDGDFRAVPNHLGIRLSDN